tara:strand:- start:33 stop:260 length:228 start_codon:yes stop_codon:yes gene_type:complete
MLTEDINFSTNFRPNYQNNVAVLLQPRIQRGFRYRPLPNAKYKRLGHAKTPTFYITTKHDEEMGYKDMLGGGGAL